MEGFEKRVLLVEDDEIALRGLSRGLRAIGYVPLAASSVAEARCVFSTWSTAACALALVDNRLEDGYGIDLLPELTALVPSPAVALISGFLDSDLATRAFKRGAIPLGKPPDADTLREILEILVHLRKRSHFATTASSNPPESSCSAVDLEAEPLVFGPFVLRGHSLTTPEGPLRLRRAESRLLAQLARRRPGAVCMAELAKVVLGRDDDGSRRSLHSHVMNLRVRLGPYAALVETEHKFGYRLALEVFPA